MNKDGDKEDITLPELRAQLRLGNASMNGQRSHELKPLKEKLNSIAVKTFGLCKDNLPEAKFAQETFFFLMQRPRFSGGTDMVF